MADTPTTETVETTETTSENTQTEVIVDEVKFDPTKQKKIINKVFVDGQETTQEIIVDIPPEELAEIEQAKQQAEIEKMQKAIAQKVLELRYKAVISTLTTTEKTLLEQLTG